jgi:membrane protein implicated in regulation of membrane protease activity
LRRGVVLPLLLAAAIMSGGPVLLAAALRPDQFGVIAACMASLLLFPVNFLLLIAYVLLIAIAFYTAKGYKNVRRLSHGALTQARRLNLRVGRISKQVARPVIALNVRFAALERLLPFQKHESDEQ